MQQLGREVCVMLFCCIICVLCWQDIVYVCTWIYKGICTCESWDLLTGPRKLGGNPQIGSLWPAFVSVIPYSMSLSPAAWSTGFQFHHQHAQHSKFPECMVTAKTIERSQNAGKYQGNPLCFFSQRQILKHRSINLRLYESFSHWVKGCKKSVDESMTSLVGVALFMFSVMTSVSVLLV